MSVTTTPLTATIGAEIAGMKGRELADPWVAVECLALLDRYGVLVYREANVSDAELVDFSRLLGEVVSNPTGEQSTASRRHKGALILTPLTRSRRAGLPCRTGCTPWSGCIEADENLSCSSAAVRAHLVPSDAPHHPRRCGTGCVIGAR